MRLTIVIAAVVLTARCGLSAPSEPLPCDRLYTDGRSLWLTHDVSKGRKLLSDPLGVTLPHLSPGGSQLVYAHALTSGVHGLPSLVVCTRSGATIKVLDLPDLGLNAIMRLGWRDDRHLWFEGHRSPSSGSYYDLDIETGTTKEGPLGAAFSVSPDGRYLVNSDIPPHLDRTLETQHVLVNGREIYPPSDDPAPHAFPGTYAWAPNSDRFAFLDSISGSEDWRLMIATVDGIIVHIASVPTRVVPDQASWLKDGTLVISSDGAYFAVDTKSGSLRPIEERAFRSWRYVSSNGKSLPVEDERCPRPELRPRD
jgi:hypothetical protein